MKLLSGCPRLMRSSRWAFFAAFWVGIAVSPAAEPRRTPLQSLLESEWEYQVEQRPMMASEMGDRRWNDRWDDVSAGTLEARERHRVALVQRLRAMDRSRLVAPDRLNYDLVLRDAEVEGEEYRLGWRYVPLNQREGIQHANDLAESLPFEAVKDYEDWVGRLRGFGAYMDQTLELMREGLRRRVVLPRIIAERLVGQVDHQRVADPVESPFYKPFRQFAVTVPEAERVRLRREAAEAIRSSVLPAFQGFKLFLEQEYLPGAFPEVGIWQSPKGAEMYAFFARKFTTTSMTPEEIHQTGLREVSRIRMEMERIRDRAGFKGGLPAFFEFLRHDRSQYYETAEELITAYRALCKRVDPALVRVFQTLPRIPYGVESIPDLAAPDTTTAYYRPPAADGSRAGSYFVNLYRPETRKKFEMVALTLHEAVPGHHFQIALAMEQGDLPKFRRYGGYTAYVEGWALYAESLGEELGLYDDPYAKFGQLTYEMWRSIRLVVDTGIHHKRWSRKQAIDYFMANAAKSELDVVNEVDRYIAWPGQALAYKVGELKIRELRTRAERALGRAFDLKRFHDVVLLAGALPLDVLEQRVDAWIAETLKTSGTK